MTPERGTSTTTTTWRSGSGWRWPPRRRRPVSSLRPALAEVPGVPAARAWCLLYARSL